MRVAELGMDVCAPRAILEEFTRQQPAELRRTSSARVHSSQAGKLTKLVEEVHKIRSSDVTVLVTGESGTGKGTGGASDSRALFASLKVFVPFNCTAVPKGTLGRLLFGYRRGAFTGAQNRPQVLFGRRQAELFPG
jgi:transcriptional regulator with GAF, ATPase, and Fis domain